MEKIFILAEKENWITDELEREWINYIKNNNNLKEKYQYTNSIINADIIWILSDYIVHRVPKELFLSKRVITTIHHIVPWKMDQNKKNHFKYLDEISNEFVTNQIYCFNELKKYVTKPIKVIPFWHNENVWFPLRNKQTELRNKYNIPNNNKTFIIGSFQKDTEGAGIEKGIIKPKLEKGPDLFIEAVKKYKEYKKQTNINICVILTGYRRHYVINELQKLDIPYIYIKMCDFKTLNELYSCLDLYIVASRVEGGPRAINECALTKTPLLTTRVGICDLICYPDSIFDMNDVSDTILKCRFDVNYNYEKSQKYLIKNYMNLFTEALLK